MPTIPLGQLKEILDQYANGPKRSAPLCTFCGQEIQSPDLKVKIYSAKSCKKKRSKTTTLTKFLNPEELLYAVEQYLTQ